MAAEEGKGKGFDVSPHSLSPSTHQHEDTAQLCLQDTAWPEVKNQTEKSFSPVSGRNNQDAKSKLKQGAGTALALPALIGKGSSKASNQLFDKA